VHFFLLLISLCDSIVSWRFSVKSPGALTVTISCIKRSVLDAKANIVGKIRVIFISVNLNIMINTGNSLYLPGSVLIPCISKHLYCYRIALILGM
jgi:hypothetical protein